MLKLDHKIFGFLLIFILTAGVSASAMDEGDSSDEFEMENRARQAHKLAASDMMYQNEEWKAIYYQNQVMIQLLKEIREQLKISNTRATLEAKL